MNKTELKEKLGLTDTSNLNNYGILQLELIEKGRDYVLESIPPEDIRCEEDLYDYPIQEYEELYDLMITEEMKDFHKIMGIVMGLDEDLLGEYVSTRIVF